jgi:hypothetical protein
MSQSRTRPFFVPTAAPPPDARVNFIFHQEGCYLARDRVEQDLLTHVSWTTTTIYKVRFDQLERVQHLVHQDPHKCRCPSVYSSEQELNTVIQPVAVDVTGGFTPARLVHVPRRG